MFPILMFLLATLFISSSVKSVEYYDLGTCFLRSFTFIIIIGVSLSSKTSKNYHLSSLSSSSSSSGHYLPAPLDCFLRFLPQPTWTSFSTIRFIYIDIIWWPNGNNCHIGKPSAEKSYKVVDNFVRKHLLISFCTPWLRLC